MADLVPWTFGIGGDVQEQWDWLTDVLPAPTGPEQRRRLRQSPRILQQFDGLESGSLRRWMEHLLVVNGAGLWDVPLPQDGAEIAEAVSIGDTVIAADARLRRFVPGGRVMLIDQDPRTSEVIEIASVTDTTVTLAEATGRAWSAGARIMPTFASRFDQVPSLSRFTRDDAPLRLEFRLLEPIDWSPDAGAAVYRTAPVLELVPDWSSDPSFAPERAYATEDNDTGLPAVFDQPGIPLSRFTMGFAPSGRDEIAAFRSLLYALAGRWSPIWVPSQALDLDVKAALVSGSPHLDVGFSGISEWPLQVNRRDIRLELANGSVLYRRINSATSIDVDTERLVLDSNLGVSTAADQVAKASFMALCRQDTDVNLLRYWTSDMVEAEMTFRATANEL